MVKNKVKSETQSWVNFAERVVSVERVSECEWVYEYSARYSVFSFIAHIVLHASNEPLNVAITQLKGQSSVGQQLFCGNVSKVKVNVNVKEEDTKTMLHVLWL